MNSSAGTKPLPTFWRLQLLGWGGFYVAMSFSRVGSYPLAFMLVEKALLTLLGVGASLAPRSILRRLLRGNHTLPLLVTTSVVASYVVALVWTALFNVGALPIAELFLGRRGNINSLGELLSGSVYHSFALVAWSFLYLGIKHYEALQLESERALRAEASAATARLRALQYQLNPHLFFNTLNAISTLLVERRNDDAALMIARLGDFMRAILKQDATTQVSLAEELALAGRYLDIEQIRFGPGLRVTYDVDEDAYRGLVPLLLLQPLVENAIRHGVARNNGQGTIAIMARRQDGTLDISVANALPETHTNAGAGVGAAGDAAAEPGANRDSYEETQAGVGLANTRERLSVLYGTRQRFHASRQANGTFTVEIALPFVPQVAS